MARALEVAAWALCSYGLCWAGAPPSVFVLIAALAAAGAFVPQCDHGLGAMLRHAVGLIACHLILLQEQCERYVRSEWNWLGLW